MPSLHELQGAFARGLHGDTTALDAWVSRGSFTAAERLGIYRNNYRISLRGALADVYPVVATLVGEGFFAFAADRYLPRFPSRCGNLHDFGSEFAPFLATLPQAAQLQYLPDVARLEWAWHRAFHAADAPVLDLAALAQIPAEQHGALRFVPAASLSLIDTRWPVTRIWEAHQHNEGPASTIDLENIDLGNIDLESGGEWIAVHRVGDAVQVTRVPRTDYAMLQAFVAAAPLETACEAVMAVDARADIGAVLARVCASGALARIQLP